MFLLNNTQTCKPLGYNHLKLWFSKNLVFEQPKPTETPSGTTEKKESTPQEKLENAKNKLFSANKSLQKKIDDLSRYVIHDNNSRGEYQNANSLLTDSQNLLKNANALLQSDRNNTEKIDQTTQDIDKLSQQHSAIEFLLDQFAYREARRVMLGAIGDSGMKAKGSIQEMMEGVKNDYRGIIPAESVLPENIEKRNALLERIQSVKASEPNKDGSIDNTQALAKLDSVKAHGADKIRIAAEKAKKHIDLEVQKKLSETTSEIPEFNISSNPLEDTANFLKSAKEIMEGKHPFVKNTLQDVVDDFQAELDTAVMNEFNNNPKPEVATVEYLKHEAQRLERDLRYKNPKGYDEKKNDIDALVSNYTQKMTQAKTPSERIYLMKEYKAQLDIFNEENLASARILVREEAEKARKKKPSKKEDIDAIEVDMKIKLESEITDEQIHTPAYFYFHLDQFRKKLNEL